MTDDCVLRDGDLVNERFRIQSVLESGAFGQVFLAYDERLGSQVAIKVLKSEPAKCEVQRQRFEEEARAISRIDSPHVVSIYDIGWHQGIPYFVMPRLRGMTLEERIQTSRGLPPNEAEYILRGILKGLSAAHEAGFVHRDIKPSNVFLKHDTHRTDGWGWPIILDFGVAREEGRATLTAAGSPIGTPQYMAPEQRRGEVSSPAADVYSVGLLAFEMLVGARPPVDHNTKPRPLHENRELCQAGVTPRLGAAIDRALEPSPEERFADAGEFLEALEAPEDPRKLAAGMIVNGVYELCEVLGQGGMSVVWSAIDRELDEPVAIKFLSPPYEVSEAERETLRRRFEREARLLAALSHRHIVGVRGFGTWQGLSFVAMERVEGKDLTTAYPDLSWRELLLLLSQVAQALDAVHERGIVHRDVTARNILVRDGEGGALLESVLIDFGIARPGSSMLTVEGQTPGNPRPDGPGEFARRTDSAF